MKHKNKYEKLFERLELNSEFSNKIQEFRNKYSIPLENGLNGLVDFNSWKSKQNDQTGKKVIADLHRIVFMASQILKKELPPELILEPSKLKLITQFYVTMGQKGLQQIVEYNPLGLTHMEIDLLGKSDLEYLKSNFPKGIILVTSPDTTQEEIIGYVKKIEPLRFSIIQRRAKRIRSLKKNSGHKQIINFYETHNGLSLADLRAMVCKSDKYVEPYGYDKFDAIAKLYSFIHKTRLTTSNLKQIILRKTR